MHWCQSGSPCKTKFKQTLSEREMICTVFWDRRGILLVDLLTRCEAVNAERYCETLEKLRRVIQNTWRRMLGAGVILLHDNARLHTSRQSTHHLQEFSWDVFNHPPYSPDDLMPSDFNVFLYIKKFLSASAFSEWQAECHRVVLIPDGRLLRHMDTKVGPTVLQLSQFLRWICWKIAQHMLYLFQFKFVH